MANALDLWVDYSAGRMSNLGNYAGALRYIALGGPGKLITADELAALTHNGKRVALVAEYDTHDAEHHFDTGYANGTLAVRDAKAVGYQQGGVACAADEHLTNAGVEVAMEYLNGFRQAITDDHTYFTGAYGFAEFIETAKARGLASWFWQAGDEGLVREGTHFYQQNYGSVVLNGIKCDVNKRLMALPWEDVDVTPQELQDGLVQFFVKSRGEPSHYLDKSDPNYNNPAVNPVLNWQDAVWDGNGQEYRNRDAIKLNGDAIAKVNAKVDALTAKVDALTVGGIDYATLAAALADKLRGTL